MNHLPDLAAWPIHARSVERSRWGLNNETWFVEADEGKFILRVYSTEDRDVIRAEHELLGHLVARHLPYATPRVVPRHDGSTFGATTISQREREAVLFERIAGEHLDDDDLTGVASAGAAFALLDRELVSIETRAAPFNGDLRTVSPYVRNLNQLEELGPEGIRFVQVADDLSRVRATLHPRQLIHGDFGFGNILVELHSVTGILDFEFACVDARAAELAAALRLVLSKGSRDQLWRPLLRGYLAQLRLEDHEIDALPVLTLHQEAVLLIWSLGRARIGLTPPARVEQNVLRALSLGHWMAQHGTEVVREARGAR